MAFDVHLPSRRISAVDFPRLGCEDPPLLLRAQEPRTNQASEPPDDDPGIVPAGHPGRCGALGGLVGRPTAHRGQPRGQKGWNRSAPAATGADSGVIAGADTEIRTQDLLFTKQLLYR